MRFSPTLPTTTTSRVVSFPLFRWSSRKATMPSGLGERDSAETNLNRQSCRTQREGKVKGGDPDRAESAGLGQDFTRSPAAVEKAERPKILLCVSGSVAVVKVPELAVKLAEFAEIKIVVTEASKHFLDRSEAYDGEAHAAFSALNPPIRVLADADEWGAWDAVGDPVLHIQLRDWADMLLVAPLSANTLAKLANGLCDNLVTCVARAWDFRSRKGFVVAPAMNTHMWDHPLTNRHLSILKELGVVIVPPASKRLACGDMGECC